MTLCRSMRLSVFHLWGGMHTLAIGKEDKSWLMPWLQSMRHVLFGRKQDAPVCQLLLLLLFLLLKKRTHHATEPPEKHHLCSRFAALPTALLFQHLLDTRTLYFNFALFALTSRHWMKNSHAGCSQATRAAEASQFLASLEALRPLGRQLESLREAGRAWKLKKWQWVKTRTTGRSSYRLDPVLTQPISPNITTSCQLEGKTGVAEIQSSN